MKMKDVLGKESNGDPKIKYKLKLLEGKGDVSMAELAEAESVGG